MLGSIEKAVPSIQELGFNDRTVQDDWWYKHYRESHQYQPVIAPVITKRPIEPQGGRGYASGRGAEDMDLNNTIFAVGVAVALTSDSDSSTSDSSGPTCD